LETNKLTRGRTSRATALTTSTKPSVERKAKRLSRQQKNLEREIMQSDSSPVTLTGAKSRGISIRDVKQIEPKTDAQAQFFDSYQDADAFVLYGSAGTGKTFLSCYNALLDVFDPESPFHKIVIIRSTVQVRDMGFLPGAEEKIAPYHDIFAELVGRKDAYEKLKDMGKIEFVSTTFLRGISLKNCIILVDEVQNCNWAEIKTVCTRVGVGSKIIFCGDGIQTDLTKSKNDVSGFRELLDVTRSMSDFRHVKFTEDDIVRSGFVKDFIKACNKLGI
jgi:phosphate starvation-inducible protein PhoH